MQNSSIFYIDYMLKWYYVEYIGLMWQLDNLKLHLQLSLYFYWTAFMTFKVFQYLAPAQLQIYYFYRYSTTNVCSLSTKLPFPTSILYYLLSMLFLELLSKYVLSMICIHFFQHKINLNYCIFKYSLSLHTPNENEYFIGSRGCLKYLTCPRISKL